MERGWRKEGRREGGKEGRREGGKEGGRGGRKGGREGYALEDFEVIGLEATDVLLPELIRVNDAPPQLTRGHFGGVALEGAGEGREGGREGRREGGGREEGVYDDAFLRLA